MIGGFGDFIVNDSGWQRTVVYGGFSAALLMMGLTSPLTGRLIDRYGGRLVMAVGSILIALGCVGIALSHHILIYYASWICLGIAMRFTLYDAAFATLAHIGGPGAKKAMAQITLLGGLASTVFWPIGYFTADHFGWRAALFIYAGFAIFTVFLHLTLPKERDRDAQVRSTTDSSHLTVTRHDRFIAGSLFAVIVTLANFLNSGMSSHMISILSGFGLAASVSVWIATLRGVGQFIARLSEVLFGSRIHPLTLNLIASVILPFCFIAGLLSGHFVIAAITFALLYGAGNGVLTITRGTMPLVLFDHRTYGGFVGQLLVPSFLLSAVSPLAYAFIIEHVDESTALYLSVVAALTILLASVTLKLKFSPKKVIQQEGSKGS